jgi:hypothetical protein
MTADTTTTPVSCDLGNKGPVPSIIPYTASCIDWLPIALMRFPPRQPTLFQVSVTTFVEFSPPQASSQHQLEGGRVGVVRTITSLPWLAAVQGFLNLTDFKNRVCKYIMLECRQQINIEVQGFRIYICLLPFS